MTSEVGSFFLRRFGTFVKVLAIPFYN